MNFFAIFAFLTLINAFKVPLYKRKLNDPQVPFQWSISDTFEFPLFVNGQLLFFAL